jgi:hypothetical protein
MRIDGVACVTAVLVVSVWTSAVWAQAQTGAPAHGHDQASAAQGMQPPKTVLKEVTDTIAKMPQHEVRVVTATLPAGVTGGWHKHSAPVYVYLSEASRRSNWMVGRCTISRPGRSSSNRPTR